MFVSPSLLYDRAGIDHGALGDGLVLADHADLPLFTLNIIAYTCAGLDMAALGDDGAADDRAVFNGHIRHDHAVGNFHSLADRAACGDNGVRNAALNVAALSDETFPNLGRFCNIA